MSSHGFRPGDILARTILPKSKLLWHFGVLTGPDEVVHLDLRGVNVCTFAEFAAGKVVKLALHITASDREAAINRARSAIGTGGYRILDNNCEKFANWCATGEDNCGLQASLVKIVTETIAGPARHQHSPPTRSVASDVTSSDAVLRKSEIILADARKRLDDQNREMEKILRRSTEQLEEAQRRSAALEEEFQQRFKQRLECSAPGALWNSGPQSRSA